MAALLAAMKDGRVEAEPAIVISNVPSAAGLDHAKSRGVPTAVVDHKAIKPRDAHDRAVLSVLREHRVDIVCLAGYMRFLSPTFVEAYRGRILNIHPSLLPAFPGLDAQRQALEAGVKVSGCTVHLVDEMLDHGPILLQRTVPVLPGDTVETLSARILEQEHRLYPEALALIASR
jgi:phosphoribosylglycinamide formyltransferase-1